jgi:hypothetical protein
VDAAAGAQYVGAIYEVGGAVRYVSQHFMKPGQAPPEGWKGHRVSYTRDYLVRPASALRVEARHSLQVKRELWKLAEAGLDAAEALAVAEATVDAAATESWELVQVRSRANPRYRPIGQSGEKPADGWALARGSWVNRTTGEFEPVQRVGGLPSYIVAGIAGERERAADLAAVYAARRLWTRPERGPTDDRQSCFNLESFARVGTDPACG